MNLLYQDCRVLLQRRSAQDIFPSIKGVPRMYTTWNQVEPQSAKTVSHAKRSDDDSSNTIARNAVVRYVYVPTVLQSIFLVTTQLDLTSSLFSTQTSRVAVTQIGTRRAVLWSTSILPLLPGLIFAQTVWPAMRTVTSPRHVRLLRCADQLLTS